MGFEIGRKLRSNLSEGPNSLNDCLSAKVATSENPIFSSKKRQVYALYSKRSITLTLFAFGEFYCYAVIFGLRRVIFASRVLGE